MSSPARSSPICDVTRTDGAGNLQWPDGSPCTQSPLVADPQLAALDANGAMVPADASAAKGIASGCPPTDQLGHPRSEPCTAGAVE